MTVFLCVVSVISIVYVINPTPAWAPTSLDLDREDPLRNFSYVVSIGRIFSTRGDEKRRIIVLRGRI